MFPHSCLLPVLLLVSVFVSLSLSFLCCQIPTRRFCFSFRQYHVQYSVFDTHKYTRKESQFGGKREEGDPPEPSLAEEEKKLPKKNPTRWDSLQSALNGIVSLGGWKRRVVWFLFSRSRDGMDGPNFDGTVLEASGHLGSGVWMVGCCQAT